MAHRQTHAALDLDRSNPSNGLPLPLPSPPAMNHLNAPYQGQGAGAHAMVPMLHQAPGARDTEANRKESLYLSHLEVRARMPLMMNSITGQYQGFVRSYRDYDVVNCEYLRTFNTQVEESTDIPRTDEQYSDCIRQLFEAATDYRTTTESAKSTALNKLKRGDWSDLDMELILWPLLVATIEAQNGKCRLPRYASNAKEKYNNFDTFADRFGYICRILRECKDVVASLFKDATYRNRLAWRPETELKQKLTNRKLNGSRSRKGEATEENVQEDKNDEPAGAGGKSRGNSSKNKRRNSENHETPMKKKRRTSSSSPADADADADAEADAGTPPGWAGDSLLSSFNTSSDEEMTGN
ncbi:hypothetical protein M426DRAFT_9014 [Hypoxylon sp. CI-4A]|nr:hypothetical protein M426DRAFT_9014 [Hypoxylon sp. CI-4A]